VSGKKLTLEFLPILKGSKQIAGGKRSATTGLRTTPIVSRRDYSILDRNRNPGFEFGVRSFTFGWHPFRDAIVIAFLSGGALRDHRLIAETPLE